MWIGYTVDWVYSGLDMNMHGTYLMAHFLNTNTAVIATTSTMTPTLTPTMTAITAPDGGVDLNMFEGSGVFTEPIQFAQNTWGKCYGIYT